MKILSLCFLFIFMSCQKLYRADVMENKATKEQAKEIQKTLAELQKDFEEIGVYINPYDFYFYVNDLPKSDGLCHSSPNKGIAIGIDESVFEMNYPDQYKSPLYTLLLHEIGHCVFNRRHDNDILEYKDSSLVLNISSSQIIYEKPYRFILKSVMYGKPSRHEKWIPKVLLKYYLQELAGIARIETWEDLSDYTDVRLHKYQIQN